MAKFKRVNQISFQKVGNWEGTIRALEEMGYSVEKTARDSQRRIAKEIVEAVIKHIQAQDLNWRYLAKSTRDRKGHDKIYVDSNTYINAIGVIRSGNRVAAGVKEGVSYKKRGSNPTTVGLVARWMEHGIEARSIPARPLWAPTITNDFGGAKGIRDRIANDIYSKIKRKIKGTGITLKDIRGIKLARK